jgi:hypothetical protein
MGGRADEVPPMVSPSNPVSILATRAAPPSTLRSPLLAISALALCSVAVVVFVTRRIRPSLSSPRSSFTTPKPRPAPAPRSPFGASPPSTEPTPSTQPHQRHPTQQQEEHVAPTRTDSRSFPAQHAYKWQRNEADERKNWLDELDPAGNDISHSESYEALKRVRSEIDSIRSDMEAAALANHAVLKHEAEHNGGNA